MNKVIQFLFFVVLSSWFLVSCSNGEALQPRAHGVPDMMEQGAADTIHVLPSIICGGIVTGSLVNQNGNVGAGNPMGPATYGTWEMFSTPIEMFVDIKLTRGYFMYAYSVYMGSEAGIPTYPNGSPNPSAFMTQGNPAILRNNLEIRWPITRQMSCPGSVQVLFNAKIVELDFLSVPISETDVWMEGTPVGSFGARKVTFCAEVCPTTNNLPCDQDPGQYSACTPIPAIANLTRNQTNNAGNLNVNNANDIILIDRNGTIGDINFNAPGTVIIPEGRSVTGGINANNGGRIIVRGTLNWSGSANLGGSFSIQIAQGATVNRTGSFNINSQTGQVINHGTFNLSTDLNSQSPTYNAGLMICNGVNLGGVNGKIINGNAATFQVQQYFNMNNGSRVENCGNMEVGANLEVNSGSTFINRAKLNVRQATHVNGAFENYCRVTSGQSGNGDGFSIQGTRVVFGKGSSLITRNFLWTTAGKVDMQGDAKISVAQYTLNPDGTIASIFGPGTLRVNSGVKLVGAGVLTICDIDPMSGSDIPLSGTFPTAVLSRITTNSYTSVVLNQCNTAVLPMAPMQQSAIGN